MTKQLLAFVAFVLFAGQVLAQRTITGTVTDLLGNGLENVSVQVKGTNVGTTTGVDGSYSLNVTNSAKVLVFSFVDFQTEERPIGASNVINVTLTQVQSELEEVVVVGYGTARKLGTVVGSVAKISEEVIKDRPSANVLDALQGKVAGLQVFTSSGEPSAVSSVRLHGVGSLGASSTPLYVLDGVPINSGSIISLNPEDFESITVLKDASATSIYGSRAANGVIYITTKKGKAGKSTINFEAQYGMSNLVSTDYFNSVMNTKELTDFWVNADFLTRGYVDTLLQKNPHDTRWYEFYYRENAPSYQGNLNISGGGGKTTYYISGGYFKQEGLAYRSDFERYTLRSNVTSTVKDWMRMGANLSLGYDDRQTNPYGTNSTNRGLALLAQPFYSPYDENGNEYPDLIPGWGRYNPKYLADKMPFNGKNVQFNPTGFIEITPVKSLTLKSQAGLDAFDYTETAVRLPSYKGSLNNGSVSEYFSRGVARTITNTAEYKFNVSSNHHFIALAGQEFSDYSNSTFTASSTGQTDDRLILLSAGPNNKNAVSSKTEYAYLSYFGRLDYDLNNKYFVTLTARQDQSSRFGRNNRTANFWSVGGMWKAKSETFLQDVAWLNDLSVKATYGTSGNSDIGNYDNLAKVSTLQYGGQTGWQVSYPGNPNLSWEQQSQANFGITARLFNRLDLEVEYYNRVTSDMLIDVPYPYTSGFDEITANTGSLRNSGVDVAISGDVIRTRDAYLTPYVNFNYNKNEVTELFQGKEYWIIPNTGVSWAVGQPVSFFYPIFAGVNPQTGLPEWYQRNPDDIVDTRKDPNAVTSDFNEAELEQNTGIKRYPPFNGGFGLNGGYKGFSLSVDFSFSQGKYLINNDRYFFENPEVFFGFNQLKTVQDYWKKPGDVTRFPKLGEQFTEFDSRLIEDASFLRMKGITVGYTFSEDLLGATNFLTGARLYVTGRNLLTFTKYSGPDPEVDTNLTLGANPNTKQVVFGIDIKL